jgi:hypothetical protein
VDDGTEPIADEELLYRRVSAASGWYSPENGLEGDAYRPHRTADVSGISVDRAKYRSPAEAAKGRPGKAYYVAVLRAGDLRLRGIAIVPRPEPGNPGHAELLVSLTLSVEGPFPGHGNTPE